MWPPIKALAIRVSATEKRSAFESADGALKHSFRPSGRRLLNNPGYCHAEGSGQAFGGGGGISAARERTARD